MVHDGKHFSIASVEGMSERTVILNGCSKTYAMTGYRIGWGITKNKEMAEALEKLACNDTSCPNAIAQYAALEALTGPQDQVNIMLQEYKKRRDLLVKLVNEIKGISGAPTGISGLTPTPTKARMKVLLKPRLGPSKSARFTTTNLP